MHKENDTHSFVKMFLILAKWFPLYARRRNTGTKINEKKVERSFYAKKQKNIFFFIKILGVEFRIPYEQG